MMRTTCFCTSLCTSLGTALLLTASSGAWAGENEDQPDPGAPAAAQPAPTPEAPLPAPAVLPAPPPVQDLAAEVGARQPSEPQPYKGWGRGVRAPIYVNMMMTAGAYGEDGSNRLTTRELADSLGISFHHDAVRLTHTAAIVVVGADGQIHSRHTTLRPDLREVVNAVESLALAETKARQSETTTRAKKE